MKASWWLFPRGYHGWLIASSYRSATAFRLALVPITDNTAFPCIYVRRKHVALSVIPIDCHLCDRIAYSDYSRAYTLGGKPSLLINGQLLSWSPKFKELVKKKPEFNDICYRNQSMENILSQFSPHQLQNNNLRSILILLYHLHIYFQSVFFNLNVFYKFLAPSKSDKTWIRGL